MKIKIKKLHYNAKVPSLGTELAIGYDLYIPEDTFIPTGRKIIPLGFAIEMPANIEGKIEARSGYSAKGMEGYGCIETCQDVNSKPERYNADVLSGKIDPDYRDSVGAIVLNHGEPFWVRKNTRIAQLTFYKTESAEWEEVSELSESNRNGGFGSTN